MVDLLFQCGPHKDTGLASLFGQAVVDVGDNGKIGAMWVAEAHIDPIISKRQQRQ